MSTSPDPHSQPLGDDHGLSAERRAALRQMAPELFAGEDGHLDVDALLAFFDVQGDQPVVESFGLNWVGRSDARRAAGRPASGTLVPEALNDSQNLIIEGDNLEVLRILRKSYSGRVKLVYIDPPYNTGNDFVYPDNYAEPVADYLKRAGAVDDAGIATSANTRADGRFHSKWLTMMYPRLKLAHELMRDDGVIFVSIDDNEVHNLRALMNEVFGEENFVAQITVQSNKGGQDYLPIAKTHEYVLCYTSSFDTQAIGELERDPDRLPFSDTIGAYDIRELRNRNPRFTRQNRPNLFYPFYINPNIVDQYGYSAVSIDPTSDYSIEALPRNSKDEDSCWRWGKPKATQGIVLNNPSSSSLVAKKTNTGKWNIYEKSRLSTVKAKTIWDETEVRTEAGTRSLNELLPSGSFSHPKPLFLIQKIIEIGASEGIILDFFAGSGSTAHAVFAQNAKDGGEREVILVQFPEILTPKDTNQKTASDFLDSIGKPRTIAEITKERVRRAAAKIRSENPMFAGDLGFRSFKLAASHIKPLAQRTHADIASASVDMFAERLLPGWTVDGLCTEVLLREGFPLTTSATVVHGWRVYESPDVGFPLLLNFADPIGSVDDLCAHLAAQTGSRGVNKRHGIAVCLDRALSTSERLKLAEYVTLKTI